MLLKLDVLASTTIKRKKPWPKLAWLGKDVGDLFLFDSHRISQLHLPSGKAKKKIPSLQSFLEDAQGFGISPTGLCVAGALNSGKVFIWNKRAGIVRLTAVLDKIRNVQGSTKHTSPILYVSDCGRKVLLLLGFRQVFLWESHDSSETVTSGDSLRGAWLQIQSGNYVLPDEKDKETAVHGLFYMDPVCGTSATISWVFNKKDRIHITALHLLWSGTRYNLQDGDTSGQVGQGLALSFTPRWSSFVHPLYNLTPAERVIKSRKAYVARVSPDGQVMVIAMNQKLAAHSRMMFYSLSRSAVAVIADLKGCGARVAHSQPSGRSWWIADMAWTSNSLLVVCITRRGCVAILTKLGEPLEISTVGCSVHMGPGLFLCLHPRIQFQRSPDIVRADSPESVVSEKDPLCQKFSVAVHPSLPLVLSSDGYLVTVMQLPPAASYPGVMTGLMKDVVRLVPDVDVEIQPGNLSRVSSVSKISILQAEASMSRGVSTEFLSDAPSENNSSGSSSVVPGYGLASGEHGIGAFGLDDADLESTSPVYSPGSADAILQAQSLCIVALSLGASCGANWKNEVGTAMDLTVSAVVKFFQFLLQSPDNVLQLQSSRRPLSKSIDDLSRRRGSGPSGDLNLHKALVYFRMALEVFQWDSSHRNVFSRAFHLTHGIVREILLLRNLSALYRVTTCMQVLKLAERVLNLVYSSSGSEEDISTGKSSEQQQPANTETAEEKEGSRQGDLDEGTTPGSAVESGAEEPAVEVPQQTVTQTHLGGPWLLLYNFTSDSCKKLYSRRNSSFSEHDSDGRRSGGKQLVELLCEIQQKLQELGVRIPSKADEGTTSMYGVPFEGPQDSMFLRRQSSVLGSPARSQTPEATRKFRSPSRDLSFSQLSTSTPVRNGSPALQRFHASPSGKEEDSKTLLSILYLHLQQYDLRSALDLVHSLIEPLVSSEDLGGNANSSFVSNAQSSFIGSTREPGGSDLLRVVFQNYPMARVADKRGLAVVQSLARFMAAYFSNLPLYICPPYQPVPLPPFSLDHEQASAGSNAAQGSKEPSQGVAHIALERVQVSRAVRGQGLDDLWSANGTLELMLVAGLVAEGAWLARNLGDWKNALLLSFASDIVNSRFPALSSDQQLTLVFPPPPRDMNPRAIAMSRLNPTFKLKTSAGLFSGAATGSSGDGSDQSSGPEGTHRQRTKQEAGELGTEVDKKVVQEVSRIVEAGVVAGLDLVPLILVVLLDQLKELVSTLEWIVPGEFYLPYPPSYCPQPLNSNKDAMSSTAQKEETLRTEVSAVVQKTFLLLNASSCLAPCVRWYTEQLVLATEGWYHMTRNDPEFPVPASLAGYADQVFSFDKSRSAGGSLPSPKKKGKGSPKKGTAASGDRVGAGVNESKLPPAITSVLRIFREFCVIMWLLHVRDKMSKSSRKYRQLRSQTMGSEEESTAVHSVCWETLLWTTRLAPFSSFLSVSDKMNDTLLTLLSDMPPSVATAGVAAQFFNVPDVIQTASGKAKFKRLMAHFRGVSIGEAGGIEGEDPEEPLSVFFRKKCMEWEEEVSERERLFGNVCDQFFESTDFDGSEAMPRGGNNELMSQSIEVGTAFFETEASYLQFLDTFFMITVSKTLMTHHSKGPPPVPLLCSHKKHLLTTDTKSLAALQQKAHGEIPASVTKGPSTNLFRSRSFADVRTSRPRPESLRRSGSMRGDTDADIKRSNSLNDVTRLGGFPGVKSLGSSMLDVLPALAWLSRWSLEGSSLPSSNFNPSTRGVTDTQPVMRVHVSLPLLVNGLWLLQNVYWPWVSDTEVLVDIQVVRNVSPQRELKLANEEPEGSPRLKDVGTPPTSLRKVLSDSNLQRSVMRSSKRNTEAMHGSWSKESDEVRSDVDDVERQEGLHKSQSDTNIASIGLESPTAIQTQKPNIQVRREVRKDRKFTQGLDRLPKSNSDPDIPNIVVQSPTTDEEKDFNGALRRRRSPRKPGRNERREVNTPTYYSDTELASSAKPDASSGVLARQSMQKIKQKESRRTGRNEKRELDAVVNTPTYYSDTELASSVKPDASPRVPARRSKQKNKQKESQRAAGPDEVRAAVNEASEVDLVPDWRRQPSQEHLIKESPLSPQIYSASTTRDEPDFEPQSTKTEPFRQGKRKKTSSLEKEHAFADRTNHSEEEPHDRERRSSHSRSRTTHRSSRRVPDPVGVREFKNSYEQRNPTESQELSSVALANGSQLSQGQMELVLVVRPTGGNSASSSQTNIPLLRIPTAVDNCNNMEENPQNVRTTHSTGLVTRAETGSQTEHQAVTSSGSQTQRPESVPGPATDQTNGTPHTTGDGIIVTRSALVQTDQEIQPNPVFPRTTSPLLLQHLQEAATPPVHAQNVISNQPAPKDLDPRFFSAPHLRPLLHIPVNKPATNFDLSKLRLVEVPKKGEGLPLLRMPETERASSQSGMPDLSKIKFMEVQPKKAGWAPLELPQKSSPRPEVSAIKGPGTAPQWPLLRISGSQARSSGIDLSRMRMYENPPTVRAAWPLLEVPKKADPPKLIPLETIVAFEKGLRDQLVPLSGQKHPYEKENIRPTVESQQRFISAYEPTTQGRNYTGVPHPGTTYAEAEDKRRAPSRQRRRQKAQEKQTRSHSTSPQLKSSKVRRRTSLQGKIISVQPAKKTRKVDTNLRTQGPTIEDGPQKGAPKKRLKKSVSLSESELELSNISDQVSDISDEEEQYFRVERSPEPYALTKFVVRGSEVSAKGDRMSGPSKTPAQRSEEKTTFSYNADDFIPGPPSMRRMKERIGRKLDEVDEQMSAYRSGRPHASTSYDKDAETFDQQGRTPSGLQQKAVGIQVDVQEEQLHPNHVRLFGQSGTPVTLPGQSETPMRLLGQSETRPLKVTSSSQTDQLESRPSVRRELVTSGVQTEQTYDESVPVRTRAPALPPDIFMNLSMPKPSSSADSQTHVGVDMEGGVHVSGGVPPAPAADDLVDSGHAVAGRGRQFLSVADIDHDHWAVVQRSPREEKRNAAVEKEEGEETGRESMGTTDDELSTDNGASRDDEAEEKTDDVGERPLGGPDRVTFDLLDSTDAPSQRFSSPRFPPASSSSNARAVSTHMLNERMKEMSDRIVAMDQITQNMDREFKSSRVLLRAIDSIDEVLNPSSRSSSADVKSSMEHRRTGGSEPRRWRDNAPWRRERRTPVKEQPSRRLQQTQEVDDSIDVDLQAAQQNKRDEGEDLRMDEANHNEEASNDEESLGEEMDKEEKGTNRDYSDHDNSDHDNGDHDYSDAEQQSSQAEERVEDQDDVRSSQNEDALEIKRSLSDQKEKISTPQDPGREEKTRAVSPLESLSLTPEKLREIFHDKDAKKTRFSSRDRSPDARQDLKQWMIQKRTERQTDWRSQKEDLRAQEYQPFVSPTQGSSSFKKIKLMEQERGVKRRTKVDKDTQKRMESASNLISEMLSEPVPKPKARPPNLRYAGSVQTHDAKPLKGKKKAGNERYKKKPKGLPKGRQNKSNQRNASSVPQQSRVSSTSGRLLQDEQHEEAPREPEEVMTGKSKQTKPTIPRQPAPGFESQRTPRYDFVRSSTPYSTAGNLSNRLDKTDSPVTNDARVEDRESPTEDFWRSGSPTGAEFVTTATYRNFSKNRTTRLRDRDARLSPRREPGPSSYRSLRDAAETGRTYHESLTEIDRLLEDIPDDGFTLDGSRLDGIESLLDEDEELRDLLADVIGVSASGSRDQARSSRDQIRSSRDQAITSRDQMRPSRDQARSSRDQASSSRDKASSSRDQARSSRDQIPSAMRTRTINQKTTPVRKPRGSNSNRPTGQRSNFKPSDVKRRDEYNFPRTRPNENTYRKQTTRKGGNLRNVEPAVPGGSGLLPEFDDAVSPWNTGDSLRMSDDVAQLLAEAKEAVGDNLSESSGSVMSNIDWEAVDKIMSDV